MQTAKFRMILFLCVVVVLWLLTMRFGEALHPGPTLSIKTCNPTTMWNKDDDFRELCNGIVGVSETATTQVTQKILTKTYRDASLHVAWSFPVAPYAWSNTAVRGIAGGAAVLSCWPQRPVCDPLPEDFLTSNRFAETMVQYKPHHYLYAISVYGPTAAYKHSDPGVVTNRLVTIAAQRAHRYRGPSVIMGDFNCPLSKVDVWPALAAAGWIDAGYQSSMLNGHPLEPTSCDSVRHSFVLVNPWLAPSLIQCRTCHHDLFSTHPVLDALFNLDTMLKPRTMWGLPRSFDAFLHDPDIMEQCARRMLLETKSGLTQATMASDVDDFARRWTHIAEQCLASSAVETDGSLVSVSKAHFGRAWKPFLKTQFQSVPVAKRARDGDFQTIQSQCSIKLRQHRRQLHRLQSLVRQMTAIMKCYNHRAFAQACHLWLTILQAHGFPQGFGSWISFHLGWSADHNIPCLDALHVIKDCFAKWHHQNEQREVLAKSRFRKIQLLEDLPKGGKVLFQRVQGDQAPPLSYITSEKCFPINRMAWTKLGLNKLRGGPFDGLDVNLPVCFQGQEARVIQVVGDVITLDFPVRLHSAAVSDLVLVQKTPVCEPEEMHKALPGPVANFLAHCHKLGVVTHFPDTLFRLHGIVVDWMNVSMKTLKRLLHHCWIRHVATDRIDRQGFDVGGFDTFANRKAFLKLEFHERSLVEQFFTGRHFTHDMLSKFLPDVPAGPLCGNADSRHHRLFGCPELDKFHTNFRQVKRLQERWKVGNWQFGLCPWVENWWQLLEAWSNTNREFSIPSSSDTVHHIFVDGSAHFGDHQDLTISAAAWVSAVPGVTQVIQCRRAPVPGVDQSSFAGELYAILLALNAHWKVVLYCDCAAVCDLVNNLVSSGHDNGWCNRGLPFFWKPILDHVRKRRPGDIVVHKVKSHRSLRDACSDLDAWIIWGNNTVDREAKMVFSHDRTALFNKFSKAYAAAGRNRRDIDELYRYIATTGAFQLRARNETRRREVVVPAFVPADLCLLMG
eukprot:Skav206623  [mRNA]  locus=scaffold1562:332529:337027:+ [translate_table: standard]